jgi:hypothetical protein
MFLRLLKRRKKTGGVCWWRGARERSIHSFVWTLGRKVCLIRRIILNWVFKICYRNLRIGFIWYRTGTSGWMLLRMWWWTVVFRTRRRIYWVAEFEDDPRVFMLGLRLITVLPLVLWCSQIQFSIYMLSEWFSLSYLPPRVRSATGSD